MKDKIPEISREKQKLLFRIKRIQGQFAAVQRALTAGDECADILMLLAAIRGAIERSRTELADEVELSQLRESYASLSQREPLVVYPSAICCARTCSEVGSSGNDPATRLFSRLSV